MSFNLLNVLTKEDRDKIKKYIYLYGTKDNFIGVDEWLKYWSTNKIKMYKLLGNQFIHRVPFEYNKSKMELDQQISDLVRLDDFPYDFENWIMSHKDIFPSYVRHYMYNCSHRYCLLKDCTGEEFKFKLENNKKTLQFQKDMKPLRAIGRFLTYCKDIDGVDKIKKSFENFRIAHSMILNDKVIKGNMVISIHPLDFMTMSDNNSNWGSCMSWKELGCYRVGTIEMLNSNNVLCCYIENSTPYYFDLNELGNKEYLWANKKWRQLVYFTKDIIVSGKPYPYANDEITKALIGIIRDLARKNLGWTYSFGPELYKDMQYINSSFSMNRARSYIQWGDMNKHNILFDTKGMYNDMLNDNSTNYWCVRNKVKHNQIISYSGKAPCLCCGNQIIYDSYDDYDYNERYNNVNATVCDDCLNNFRCSFCEQSEPNRKHYHIFLENGTEVCICEDCIKHYIKKCPDCGKPFFLINTFGRYNIFNDENVEYPEQYIQIEDEIDIDEFECNIYSSKQDKIDSMFSTIYPICRCGKCAQKDDRFIMKNFILGRKWGFSKSADFSISVNKEKKEDWEKYFIYNLESATIADGEVITN